MSTVGVTVGNSHVPAWKRLGLKLKKDETSVASSPVRAVSDIDIPNKRSRDISHDATPTKRRKKESVSEAKSSPLLELPVTKENNNRIASGRGHEVSTFHSRSNTSKHIVFDDDDAETTVNNAKNTQTERSTPRRKSVTFTSDTKTEDGIAQQTVPGHEPLLEPSVSSSSKPPKKEKKKKPQPKASTSPPSDPASSAGTPVYVEYLIQFHRDRANWKFNKNKQTDLLKHLFDIQRLPPDLTPAVVSYIAGLNGASSRERVSNDAAAVILSQPLTTSSDHEPEPVLPMDTPEARQAAYAAALRRQLDRSAAMGGADRTVWAEETLAEIARGERAEAVLRELLQNGESLSNESVSGGKMGLGEAGGAKTATGVKEKTKQKSKGEASQKAKETKSKRSRKSRTEVSSSDESESSLSSGTSDSSEESDESEDEAETTDEEAEAAPVFDKALLDRKFGKKKKNKKE